MSLWDFFTGKRNQSQNTSAESSSSQTANRSSITQGTQTQRTVGTQGVESVQNTALNQSQFAQQFQTGTQESTTNQRTSTTQNRTGRQDTQSLSDATLAELQGITALLGDLTQQGAGAQGVASNVVDTILKNASTAKGDVMASVASALDMARLSYARGTGTAVLDRANTIGSRGSTAFMEVNNRGQSELATQLAAISAQGGVAAREQELKELSAGLGGALNLGSLNLQTANTAAAVANAEKGGRSTTNYSETLNSIADTIANTLTRTAQTTNSAQETAQLTGANTIGTTRTDVSANSSVEQKVAELVDSLTNDTRTQSGTGRTSSTILDLFNVFK
jgi:hypothetical protein